MDWCIRHRWWLQAVIIAVSIAPTLAMMLLFYRREPIEPVSADAQLDP